MKNANMNDVLKKAMYDFGDAYDRLRITIERYERTTGKSVNDLVTFVKEFPFEVSFDELPIRMWTDSVVKELSRTNFKVCDYKYLNTGGNTMIGIFQVWLPEEKRTVFALTNEEGCTLSVVDYISNELDVDDYDEFIIEYCDWGRLTGNEKYFELYRHCLNVYTKYDCRHFGNFTGIQYHLLSDELQRQVSADYLVWLEAEGIDLVDTDGYNIVTHPDYIALIESYSCKELHKIKDFKSWHDTLPDSCHHESMINSGYMLSTSDRYVQIPYTADTFSAINELLERVIEEW